MRFPGHCSVDQHPAVTNLLRRRECGALQRRGQAPVPAMKRFFLAMHESSCGIRLLHSCNNSVPRFKSEEHTSELQSLMRISYAVFCLKKKKTKTYQHNQYINTTLYIFHMREYKQS